MWLIWLGLILPAWGFGQRDSLRSQPIVLVIDPGHGGKDPGRVHSDPQLKHEKTLNLLVARKLGEYIERFMPEVKVIYTRTEDVYVSLDDRVAIANDSAADYFISIHFNANPYSDKSVGTSSHIQGHQFKTSKRWAELIEKEMRSRARRVSNGVIGKRERGQNLQVLQYTEMPGVLVECGFITNPDEERYVNTEEGQSILASALFRAFRELLESDPAPEDRQTYYKVQIAASSEPIPFEHPDLTDLDNRVEQHYYIGKKYGYRYLVGREYRQAEAIKLRDEMRKKGHQSAFVVKFHPGKPMPDKITIGPRYY